MSYPAIRPNSLFVAAAMVVACCVAGREPASGQSDTAASRMRPIGSASAVDRFHRTSINVGPSTAAEFPATDSAPLQVVRNETAFWQPDRSATPASAPLRQTVWMQSEMVPPPRSSTGMTFPDTAPDTGLPMPNAGSMPGNSSTFPGPNALRTLPAPPATGASPGGGLRNSEYAPSLSDLSPVPQPQLSTQSYARVENCALVTPPSNYMSASAFGCGCDQVLPTTYQVPAGGAQVMPPAEIASAAILPPVTVLPPTFSQPLAYPASSAPARSLITLGQQNYAVQVGQGLWGQPVAYVPGQCFRNWLRYLSP